MLRYTVYIIISQRLIFLMLYNFNKGLNQSKQESLGEQHNAILVQFEYGANLELQNKRHSGLIKNNNTKTKAPT